ARRLADRQVQAVVAELDQDDPGWRLPDIEAQRPALPDDQNSTPHVLATAKLLPPRWLAPTPPTDTSVIDQLVDDPPPPERQLSEGQVRDLREELRELDAALREARPLAELPYGRSNIHWNLNYLDTSLGKASDRRAVARLLVLEAMLQAQDKDADGACVSVRAALNAGRSFGDQCGLIGCWARTGITIMAVQQLERVLAQGEPGDDALADMQRLLSLEEREDPESLTTVVREQRALTHRLLEAIENGQLHLLPVLDRKPLTPYRRVYEFFAGAMVRRSDAFCLRKETEAVAITRLPTEEQDDAVRRWTAEPPDPRADLGRLIPAMRRVVERHLEELAYLRCAGVALALERYRRKHHGWPERPEDLLRERLLGAIPRDPYTGDKLRVLRLADRWGIYSAGPDRQDNGGAMDRKDPTAPGTDLGFRLWNVSRRRQPALPQAKEQGE
ncbi:MAG TPA: hypothetical protein VJ739_09905, partial [Gemmataceae bacterium]|nr:hypothetical protein [Gemmataceae bacterium]